MSKYMIRLKGPIIVFMQFVGAIQIIELDINQILVKYWSIVNLKGLDYTFFFSYIYI